MIGALWLLRVAVRGARWKFGMVLPVVAFFVGLPMLLHAVGWFLASLFEREGIPLPTHGSFWQEPTVPVALLSFFLGVEILRPYPPLPVTPMQRRLAAALGGALCGATLGLHAALHSLWAYAAVIAVGAASSFAVWAPRYLFAGSWVWLALYLGTPLTAGWVVVLFFVWELRNRWFARAEIGIRRSPDRALLGEIARSLVPLVLLGVAVGMPLAATGWPLEGTPWVAMVCLPGLFLQLGDAHRSGVGESLPAWLPVSNVRRLRWTLAFGVVLAGVLAALWGFVAWRDPRLDPTDALAVAAAAGASGLVTCASARRGLRWVAGAIVYVSFTCLLVERSVLGLLEGSRELAGTGSRYAMDPGTVRALEVAWDLAPWGLFAATVALYAFAALRGARRP